MNTDFLIVGSGIAGLRAAIELAPVGRVLILSKADPTESNTGYAQGGIAAALADDDSVALHVADTMRAGDGLCDEAAVQVLVEEGPRYVRELVDWGTRFDRNDDGRLAMGREAAHSVRRVLHAGDATGREIGRVLWETANRLPNVTTVKHGFVTELIAADEGVTGVRFFDPAGARQELFARTTLLATGGAGQLFRETTNPSVATGDGIALAYRAGARVADLEFVQFHPTALNHPDAPRFLISEALRGEGARLVNSRGESFMKAYHPDGDLAPRDVVARSIVREVERTGGAVSLTLAHLDPVFVHHRFPTIAEMCRRIGIDLARDLIPVGPAAHYIMGGIDTDEWGRTSVPGLFAAGEVACTGVHGANRLASNSLLEGLVFGARAGQAMQQPRAVAPLKADRQARVATVPSTGRTDGKATRPTAGPSADVSSNVKELMWNAAGLFRSREGLTDAVATLESLAASETHAGDVKAPATADDWRRRNFVVVAGLIARAALRRQESRGAHFRADFPERDDIHWKVHVVETRTDRT